MKKLWYLFLLTLLLTANCKNNTTSFDHDDNPTLEESSFGKATAGENTTVIPKETLENLTNVSEDGSVFTFSSNDVAFNNLKEGSILVMGISPNTPMGALRKVDHLEKRKSQAQDSTVSIYTVDATLEEAFKSLELDTTNINLDPTQVDSIVYKVPSLGIHSKITDQTHPKLADFAFTIPFDQVFYQSAENPEEQIKLSGELNINPSFDLDLQIDNYQLENLQLLMQNELDAELNLTATINQSIEDEVIILQYWFTPIPLGPFIVITPVFNIALGMTGSASSGIEANLTGNINSKLGIKYKSGTWEPLSNFDDPKFSGEMEEIETNVSLKGYVAPGFDFLIYGIVGPYAELQGYGEASVDANRNPKLQVYGGVGATAGVKMAIFSKIIPPHEFPDLYNWRKLIYEAGFEEAIEVTTKGVTDITETTATSGGEIINDGGETIATKGVCWGTNQEPGLSDSCTDEGGGSEPFTSELTGLTPQTQYYVRAYTSNNMETVYGQEVSFTTLDSTEPSLGVWTQIADFPGPKRGGAVSFTIGNKSYVGTGQFTSGSNLNMYNDFWEYNPETNTWNQISSIPAIGRVSAVGFSIDGKGYVGSGRYSFTNSDGLSDFWEYDPLTDNWIQVKNLPKEISGGIGFAINGKAYVGTGQVGIKYINDFWEYDPSSNNWIEKASFAGDVRRNATSFVIGNLGYIGTGDFRHSNKSDFWEYNPDTDTWIQKANFPGSSRSVATGFSIGNKGYLGTGWDGSSLNDLWQYDPLKDVWIRKADFKGSNRHSPVGFSIGDSGYIGLGVYPTDFWKYTE